MPFLRLLVIPRLHSALAGLRPGRSALSNLGSGGLVCDYELTSPSSRQAACRIAALPALLLLASRLRHTGAAERACLVLLTEGLMRYQATGTCLSWIPPTAVEGVFSLPFGLGVAHYDQPPPDELPDI